MAEGFDPSLLTADKAARYRDTADEIAAVLEGEPDRVARMATVASMLAQAFPGGSSGPASTSSIPPRATSWWSAPTRARWAACGSPSGAACAAWRRPSGAR